MISFLRGLLINHDTPPQRMENQSNPIAPGFTSWDVRERLSARNKQEKRSNLYLIGKMYVGNVQNPASW